MSGVLLFVIVATLAGLPWVSMLDRRARGADLCAKSFLLGTAAESLLLLALSVAGIVWSATSLACATAFFTLSGVAVLHWRSGRFGFLPDARERDSVAVFATGVDVLTIALLVGYALFATSGLPEFDFLSDWGLKGRVFWEHGGVNWHFLQTARWNTHADYPVLVPLCFDAIALLHGRWEDRSFGVLYVALAAATLIVLRTLLAEAGVPRAGRAIATLCLVPFAASPWIGLADGPLIAFGTCGLFLFTAHRDEEGGRAELGAILLGCAALCKNEGLTLLVFTAVAVTVLSPGSRRRVVALWPAVLLAASWQLLRLAHALHSDLAAGATTDRLREHLLHPSPLLNALARYAVGKELFWASVTLALLFTFRRAIARFPIPLFVVAAQFVSYLAAYASTPHDIDWHVRWSWERLVSHLSLALAFVAVALLSEVIWNERRGPVTASTDALA